MRESRTILIVASLALLLTLSGTIAAAQEGRPAALGDDWLPVAEGVWQRTTDGRVETYAEGEAGRRLALESFRAGLPAVTDAYLAESTGENRETLDNYLAAIAAAEGAGVRAGQLRSKAAAPSCGLLECEITSLFATAEPANCGARASADGDHVNYCDQECFLTADASAQVTLCNGVVSTESMHCAQSGSDISCDVTASRKGRKACSSTASLTLYCPELCIAQNVMYSVTETNDRCSSGGLLCVCPEPTVE